MYGRVTTAQGSPERMEEFLRWVNEQGIPAFRQRAGFRHVYVLADRQQGSVMSVSLWDSREALQRAEAALNQVRGQAMQTAGGQGQPTTMGYEVVAEA